MSEKDYGLFTQEEWDYWNRNLEKLKEVKEVLR